MEYDFIDNFIIPLHQIPKNIQVMAKFGYYFETNNQTELVQALQWMSDYGCDAIAKDSIEYEKLRPQWQQTVEKLETGDELVVYRLSNAIRGARELLFFLDFCRLKNIRIISVLDRIDSHEQLFQDIDNMTLHIFDVLANFTSQTVELKKKVTSIQRTNKKQLAKRQVGISKLERNMNVINLYKSGYPINEIWKLSGFRSRSSVFRILNDAGIKLQRGNRRKSSEK